MGALGWAGLGWAGLGWAGLDWPLGSVELGYITERAAPPHLGWGWGGVACLGGGKKKGVLGTAWNWAGFPRTRLMKIRN